MVVQFCIFFYSDHLKSMKNEIQNAEKKLKSVQNKADESQSKTKEVLDNSLDLHAKMRLFDPPTINTTQIKNLAEEMSQQVILFYVSFMQV